MMFTTIAVGLIIAFVIFSWLKMKPKDFPPGPPMLPIVGNIPFVPRKFIHVTMAGEWRQKYGPLVGLVLGQIKILAVCGPQEIIEVLKKDEFQGRPKGGFFADRTFDKYLGILFSDGALWLEQRRFTLRHLRDFGFGKRSMEDMIMEEIEDLMKDMTKNEVFQVTGKFTVSTLNILWCMISGVRFSHDDEKLQDLLRKLTRTFRNNSPAGVIGTFPILKRLVPGLVGHTETIESNRDIQEFCRQAIREHMQTIDKNNPRDLIDVYLKEMDLQSHNPKSTFTEEGLITVCFDLFTAGGETTTNALAIFILQMILKPDIQKEVQKELDTVIGRDRRPTLEDRPKLHYVEAVITELFRMYTSVPLAPPHNVTSDTYLNGYFIPKDTMVLLSIYSVLHDKEHWGDPEVFRPARFLDMNGKFVKDEWMVPFGVGKRICLGETLARNSIFLFFTTLLQEFTFSTPEGDPTPSDVPLSGLTIAAQPFRAKVTRRS